MRLVGAAEASRSLSVVGAGVAAFDAGFALVNFVEVAEVGGAEVMDFAAGFAAGVGVAGGLLCMKLIKTDARLPEASTRSHLGTSTSQS